MPHVDIVTELKSAIQTNSNINSAITSFLLDMQNLKQFYMMTEPIEDLHRMFLHYSKEVFSRWTIQEQLLLLVLLGTSEKLTKFFDTDPYHPALLLEQIFCDLCDL